MPIVATTLKNTQTHSVIRLTGNGNSTVALSSLVSTTKKKATFDVGATVIEVADTLGIVIGGKITGTGIQANTLVTGIHDHKVTIDNATTLASDNNPYTFDSQKFTNGISKVNIVKVFYDTDVTGGIKVERNSVTELSLTRSGIWAFDGFALTNNNGSDIVVTHSGTFGSTLILELRKSEGWGDAEHPLRT